MTNWELIFMILFSSILGWEVDKGEPKPYAIGNGDTLMVRSTGHGFCPNYCDIDHFHIGHKIDYDCEDYQCNHIIYEEELNVTNEDRLD
tara:strand:+ start:631 stop:897 length:267 start_codon:yes stop_codon:yes gene_type:complete